MCRHVLVRENSFAKFWYVWARTHDAIASTGYKSSAMRTHIRNMRTGRALEVRRVVDTVLKHLLCEVILTPIFSMSMEFSMCVHSFLKVEINAMLCIMLRYSYNQTSSCTANVMTSELHYTDSSLPMMRLTLNTWDISKPVIDLLTRGRLLTLKGCVTRSFRDSLKSF